MNTKHLYDLFKQFPHISTDTRRDLEGSIFFALKGELFDANKFVIQALEKGAAFAVADASFLPEDKRIIKVENSLSSLQELANYHRKQLKIPIIAITGSNGKTTTKELVTRVLKSKYNTFSTPGNLNNHIGVPLSLLQIHDEHEIAILEIGANHIGENDFLTKMIQPTHGITTNIGKDHLGEFGGVEGVIKAYKEFTDFFDSDTEKVFFMNQDDPILAEIVKREDVIRFAVEKFQKANVTASLLTDSIYLKTRIHHNTSFEIETKLFGSYNIYNILAATAIGIHFNISDSDISKAISSYTPQNNRSQVVKYKSNTIILDAYNANPSSMELAISDFEKYTHPHKVIILGDMHELGMYSEAEHQNIVERLQDSNFEQIILVGKTFGLFKDKIDCLHFENVKLLRDWFSKQNFVNCCFLLKGSRSEKLEIIFDNL